MGSLAPASILGGGFVFKYFSGSMYIVLQFFSSLTSSHSWKMASNVYVKYIQKWYVKGGGHSGPKP